MLSFCYTYELLRTRERRIVMLVAKLFRKYLIELKNFVINIFEKKEVYR